MINLQDTVFIIPFYKDSEERLENLKCILKYINDNFDTTICISEVGDKSIWSELGISGYHTFNYRTDGLFHRTQVINDGIKHSGNSPFIAIYDTDVFFVPEDIEYAVKALRLGCEFAYPYAGEFVDVHRSYIKDGVIKERESLTKDSCGGAVFINREAYWKAGLEDERIISWGPEDVARKTIMLKLKYTMARSTGKCYHISHPPSSNSGPNAYTQQNNAEFEKVKNMSREELLNYISQFSWVN